MRDNYSSDLGTLAYPWVPIALLIGIPKYTGYSSLLKHCSGANQVKLRNTQLALLLRTAYEIIKCTKPRGVLL